MRSGVVPLTGDYDIDDGVYLQNIGTDKSKWPSAATVHGWIMDAVSGSTQTPPQSRARCVRVRYEADYHVDLPVYGTDETGAYYLFDKESSTPVESDPKGLLEWFEEQCDNIAQIRDVIRYFKAWRDFKKGGSLPLKGIIITLLVARHIEQRNRDDEAFVSTAEAIATHLRYGGGVPRPVTPLENLIAGWSKDTRDSVIEELDNLVSRGNDALAEESCTRAARIWRKQLGDRFPLPAVDDSAKATIPLATPSPAILGSDGRSA